jgi:hypothetical protein
MNHNFSSFHEKDCLSGLGGEKVRAPLFGKVLVQTVPFIHFKCLDALKRYSSNSKFNASNDKCAGEPNMVCLWCGGYIVPPKKKVPRKKIYCSDVCRQRACRARNKWKSVNDYIWEIRELKRELKYHASQEKTYKLLADVRSEIIEDYEKKIAKYTEEGLETYDKYILSVKDDIIAEKDAEIVRLNFLLEHPSKKKR